MGVSAAYPRGARHDVDVAEGVTSREKGEWCQWQEESRFVSANEDRQMLSGMMLRVQRFLDQGVVVRGTDEVVPSDLEGRLVAGAKAEVHRAGLGVEVQAAGDGDREA